MSFSPFVKKVPPKNYLQGFIYEFVKNQVPPFKASFRSWKPGSTAVSNLYSSD
jgi:hypothetical protein